MSPRTVRLGPSRLTSQARAPQPSHRAPSSTAASAARSATDGASAPPLRRNLFQSHLSRRPMSEASSASTPSTTILENPFGGPGHGGGGSNGGADGADVEYGSDEATTARLSPVSRTEVGDGGNDIVLRGSDGQYAVAMPALPAMPDDKGEGFGGGETEEEPRDVEAKLLLDLLNSRTRQSSEQEVLELVQASLRRKVDSLEEDRWMYEGDDLRP